MVSVLAASCSTLSFGVSMTPRYYIVRPAIFAPAILAVAAIVAAFRDSWWFLAALPFIYLGSICAQPNLNLANGCLAYLAMLVGFATLASFRPLGLAILAGAMSGFYVSALEKWIRMRPAPEAEPCAAPNGGPATQLGNSGATEGPRKAELSNAADSR
jgi:hypothetical protein